MSDDEVRWDRSLDADEARLLVLAALAGLNDGDREVIELSLRHDLDHAALTRALGYSSSHTSARVSRAKRQFDVALTSVLLIRTRGRDCADLRTLIGEESTLTPLLRKRIARHAKDCESCTGNRHRAIAVLPGVALAFPFVGAPESIRASLVDAAGARGAAAQPRITEGDPVRFGNDGFPVLDVENRRRGIAVATVAAVLTLALVGVVSTTLGSAPGPELTGTATTLPVATKAAQTAGPPAPKAPVRSPRPVAAIQTLPSPAARSAGVAESQGNASMATTPTLAPTQAARPKAIPTAEPRNAPPITPSVSVAWSDLDPSLCGAPFDVRVSVQITGTPISSVTALWRSATDSGSTPLVLSTDQSWQGVLTAIPDNAQALLSVRVVTAQGITTTSAPEPLTNVCGG